MTRIVIIGAGISGLSLAWMLKQKFNDQISLTILEKSARPGGWIHTKVQGDFLFEQGPRCCRSRGNGIATLQLIESLGLQSELVTASPKANKRYLYSEGRLQQLPNSLPSMVFNPLMTGVLPALLREYFIPSSNTEDESIAQFFSRRFTADITDKLIDPFVAGIYAGDIHQLSMSACFPYFHRLEKDYGSVVKGAIKELFQKKEKPIRSPFIRTCQQSPLFSLKTGMEAIPKALCNNLSEDLRLSTHAIGLNIRPEHIEVVTNTQEKIAADYLFIATPASTTASLLTSMEANLASRIRSLSAASITAINLGWKEKVLQQEGFGYLVPSCEKEDILGVIWDSSVFPQHNHSPEETRLTVMLGGALRPDLTELPQHELLEKSLEALYRHLGIKKEPDVVGIHLAKQAIPQYAIGHNSNVKSIEADLDRISSSRIKLVGSSWHGVSVNDCIAEASKLADISDLEAAERVY